MAQLINDEAVAAARADRRMACAAGCAADPAPVIPADQRVGRAAAALAVRNVDEGLQPLDAARPGQGGDAGEGGGGIGAATSTKDDGPEPMQ